MPEQASDEPELTRRPWGKITAVVLAIVLALAVAALLVRHPNRPPMVVQTSWAPATPEVMNPVTFTVQATDPDGDDLTFVWNFGDGASGQSPHAYSLPGTYIAFVVVSDGKGGVATSESNFLRLNISSGVTTPAPCATATCPAGPVVAVLDADRWTATPGTPFSFFGNLSWAYLFSWNDPTNHSRGGTYARDVAWQNASLFDRFRYVWGDGSADTTGTSSSVGNTTHTFASPGTFVVRLTVTQRDPTLNVTRNATAGFTVRIEQPSLVYAPAADIGVATTLPMRPVWIALGRP